MSKDSTGQPTIFDENNYNQVAPGVWVPNDQEWYASQGTTGDPKQAMFNQGTAGGSAYRSSPFGGQGGGGGFASILGSLLGGGNRLGNLPAMPTPQTPDLGAGPSQNSAGAPVGSSGISPALTAVMRDTTTTGGAENSTIQSIMAKLLQSKRRTPSMPLAY